MRKLEIVYDLNLITSGELTAEKKAIEKYLGIRKDETKPRNMDTSAPSASQTEATIKQSSESMAQPVQPVTTEVITTVEEVEVPLKTNVNTVTKNGETTALIVKSEVVSSSTQPQNIVPEVTSPF